MSVFLREFEAPTDFSGTAQVFEFDVCSPEAYVCHVGIKKDYDDHGRLAREYIRYTVRDRGSATKHAAKKAIVVVRRLNDLIPLTDDCGKLLSYLQSALGRFEYYVFEARRAPRTIGSTDEVATSHPPSAEHAIGCHLRAPLACSCVFDGTSAHSAPPADTNPSEASPESWWESPGESKASGE
jgi:hypothetical protein